MSLVDNIKALFKRKPKVVEEKPPEATEEKEVVKPKRKSKPKDSSRVPALDQGSKQKDAS